MDIERNDSGPKVPRILVVDDMPDNLFLMNGLLEDRYEVLLAPSGAAALQVLMSKQPPDIVLLDVMMPDMDGYEVLRRIRQHPTTAAIPVIFLTALASKHDERLGLDLGAIDYLTKPVDPEQVIRRVEDHVRRTTFERRRDALAEKLSPHLGTTAWRALFEQGQDAASIRFEERHVTVVYAETALLPGWGVHGRDAFAGEVAALAERHGGMVDPYLWGASVVVFDDPRAAVRMATELQRSAHTLQLRIGVHTGAALLARFRTGGELRTTLVGAETGLAAHVAAQAAAGSIVIAPETYALVHDDVQAASRDCLLAEEFGDSELPQASLTPAPIPGLAAASTFAGLGWR